MDIETVKKVASLARIKVTEEELEKYKPQLENILKFVEQLDEVSTDNVEPLSNVLDIKHELREDKVTDGGITKDVLTNAPEELENFFVVPKVVE